MYTRADPALVNGGGRGRGAASAERGWVWAAAREQRYVANYADLQTPIGDKAKLIRVVCHFHVIVDELMNETKWIL